MKNMSHPENSDSSFTIEKLATAMKMREILSDAVNHENTWIRRMLQDAWYPYFTFIMHDLKDSEPGYELESIIYIIDKPMLNIAPKAYGKPRRYMEPWVEITFHWIPLISGNDNVDDKEFEILPAEFTETQEKRVRRQVMKYSREIQLPVNIMYE